MEVLREWEWQHSVFAELGRLGDAQAITAASERLWEECLTGRCSDCAGERGALLRRWRLGLPKGHTALLEQDLERAVEHYRAQHEGVTDEMVAEALRRAYWSYKKE